MFLLNYVHHYISRFLGQLLSLSLLQLQDILIPIYLKFHGPQSIPFQYYIAQILFMVFIELITTLVDFTSSSESLSYCPGTSWNSLKCAQKKVLRIKNIFFKYLRKRKKLWHSRIIQDIFFFFDHSRIFSEIF